MGTIHMRRGRSARRATASPACAADNTQRRGVVTRDCGGGPRPRRRSPCGRHPVAASIRESPKLATSRRRASAKASSPGFRGGVDAVGWSRDKRRQRGDEQNMTPAGHRSCEVRPPVRHRWRSGEIDGYHAGRSRSAGSSTSNQSITPTPALLTSRSMDAHRVEPSQDRLVNALHPRHVQRPAEGPRCRGSRCWISRTRSSSSACDVAPTSRTFHPRRAKARPTPARSPTTPP